MSNPVVAQLYSESTRHGPMQAPDATGQEGVQGEGPYMVMHLKLESDRVRDARFETYGCAYAIACGSWVTQWVVGRTIEQALVLEPDDVGKILAVPTGKEHCAQLAVQALRQCIRQWQEKCATDAKEGR